MKFIANLSRIIVGIIFIFSGFVKVVDPVGTGIKLEEYFEVFSQDLPSLQGFFMFFAHNSLTLSLIFCALEVILGVAMLVSYRMKITSWVIFAIIAFFTFLTFYSAYFNKVTDCGCFGDFLKLKPWTSFTKDVVLLVLILVIIAYRKIFKEMSIAQLSVVVSTIISFGIGIYAIRYLPPIDFLPYAIGKSIPEQMKPTGIKPIFEYTFLNKKTGEEEISSEFLMDTTTYKYVSSVTLNDDKVKPKITDYFVNDSQGNVYTDSTFIGNKLIIIYKKINDVDAEQIKSLNQLSNSLNGSKVQPMIMTSVIQTDYEKFSKANGINTPYFTADATVLKTMARTNPCVILLQNGVVKGKWSNHSIPTKEEILEKL
ncbi:MAG: BT_3928 family protein [Spirosomataceae bacterium]